MKRFENILFINKTTLSATTAIERAIKLARRNEAKLSIVNILDELPKSIPKLHNALLQIKNDEIQDLLKETQVEDLTIETHTLIGTAFLEIIKKVIKDKHDLVIKPAEGAGGISNILFGSTDLHLLRKCPCPVWIIKPSKHQQFSKILAAIDLDPNEKNNAELNSLIIDLATSIAHRDNSELHIIHAWNMAYEQMLRSGRGRMPSFEVDRMVEDVRINHKKKLDDFLGHYDFQNLQVKTHLTKGVPGHVIPQLADKENVDLIVMGTIARTGISGFFIGNTAEKTLASVDCSVLAVKPSSFSTPVIA